MLPPLIITNRTLLAYLWPENQPALRARVVISLSLLVSAKAVGICAPFLLKEVCDALETTKLVLASVDAAEASSVDIQKVAAVTPVAALLGCAYGVSWYQGWR